MKKRFLFILLIAVICFSSISAIHAMDINNDTLDNNVLVDSQNDDGNVSVEEEKPSTLVAPDIVKYYKNGTNFEATLKDLDGNPIPGREITFTIKGVKYIRITNADGVASLPINLLQGNYTIRSTYVSPDSSYFHSFNSKIEVLPNIVTDDLVKYCGNKYFLVKLLKSDGTPLSYSKLSFTINGKTYGWTSDSQGKARYNNLKLSPGTYTITTRNLVDNTYRVDTIKVLPTITGGNIKKYFNNGTKYTVKLLKPDGTPLQYSKLTFTVKGKTYSWTSDSQGIAALPIGLSQGKYTIVTKNLKDGTSISNTIEVLPTVVHVGGSNFYKGNTVFTVKILKSDGKPLAKSTAQFIINGKLYKNVSDSNGIVKLDLANFAKGSYSIKTINVADKSYVISNVQVYISIFTNDLSKLYLDDEQHFNVTVLDKYGKPLGNTKVDFTVTAGSETSKFSETTNDKGFAQLKIYYAPGKYTIKTYVSKLQESRTNTIQISPSFESHIKLINGEITENSGEPIKVVLYNRLNHGIHSVVNFVVDGKAYTVTTGPKGVASFNPDLKPGVYDATFIYCDDRHDDYFTGTYLDTKITVLEGKPVTVEAGTDVVNRGDYYSVTVKDAQGKPLPNIKGYFTVKGVKYNVVTNSNGVASLKINLWPQNTPIQYTVSQTNYAQAKVSADLKVITSSNAVFSSSALTYVNNQQFTVKLSIGDILLSNQPVSITLNGKSYNVVTDKNGIAKLTITGLNPGKYNVVCTYSGVVKSSKTFTINIVDKIGTKLQYAGSTTLYKEDSKSFPVRLMGSNNIPIANQNIKIIINNNVYYQKTNEDGVASLPIGLSAGTWTISYSFAGNSYLSASSGSKKINIVSKLYDRHNFYLIDIFLTPVDFSALKNSGITDLIVRSANVDRYGEDVFLNWVQKANSYGINVHIWVSVFKGEVFYPPILSDGTPNYKLMNQVLAECKYFAVLPGIAGISLDFVRFTGDAYKYPNAASVITNFVKDYSHTVKSINSKLILSFAFIGRAGTGISQYGQDVAAISKYVDVIIQLVYKSSIPGASHSLMSHYIKYSIERSNVPVWASLLGYRADALKVPIPATELYSDAKMAVNAGAYGVSVFCYGFSNMINFKTLF